MREEQGGGSEGRAEEEKDGWEGWWEGDPLGVAKKRRAAWRWHVGWGSGDRR